LEVPYFETSQEALGWEPSTEALNWGDALEA
jgi:hypothetical protein